jgi:hypothetical protein
VGRLALDLEDEVRESKLGCVYIVAVPTEGAGPGVGVGVNSSVRGEGEPVVVDREVVLDAVLEAVLEDLS